MKKDASISVRYGPAGWAYKDWEGVVYPKPKPRGFDPLTFLSQYFQTVEINSTFYGPAKLEVAHVWTERVSDNPSFKFTAKLWRRFTHERQAAWTAEEVQQTREGLDVLAEAKRLGAVLIQFPWSFKRNDENQEWLSDVLNTFSDLPLVLEVRHASWDVPELYEMLERHKVGFVNIDQPLFHDALRPSARATSSLAYIRVHGRNYKNWFRKNAGRDERFDYLYTARELEPWAERIGEVVESELAEELYVVTNNHFRGKAAANALMLEAMVEGTQVSAPPGLVAAYAEVLSPFVIQTPQH
jgi:uncharacterized protein YecE (DUF72 family)